MEFNSVVKVRMNHEATVEELTAAYIRMQKFDKDTKERNQRYYKAKHAKDPNYYAKNKATSRANAKAKAEANTTVEVRS